MLKKKEEKLKYSKFSIQLNKGIQRNFRDLELDLFEGLESILKELTLKGFIRGFTLLPDNKVQLFFRFSPETGAPMLKSIKLLTRSSLRAYRNAFELKKLYFHQKSSLNRLFILSTHEGLTIFDKPWLTKIGGELIYQIN